MARDKSRSRADHPPHARGPKTHKADVRVNRGEPEAPKPDEKPTAESEGVETTRQKQIREEHPARMKATGHQPDRRNR